MEAFLRLHSIQFRGNLRKFLRHAALRLPDCSEEETETQRDEVSFEDIQPQNLGRTSRVRTQNLGSLLGCCLQQPSLKFWMGLSC